MANPYHDFTAASRAKHGFEAFNDSIHGLGDAVATHFKQQRENEDALKTLMIKAQLERENAAALEQVKSNSTFDMQDRQFKRSMDWKQQYPQEFGLDPAKEQEMRLQAQLNGQNSADQVNAQGANEIAKIKAQKQAEFDMQGQQMTRAQSMGGQFNPIAGASMPQDATFRSASSPANFNPIKSQPPQMFINKINPMTGEMTQVENPAYKAANQMSLMEGKQNLIQSNNTKKAIYKAQNEVNTIVNGLGIVEGDIDKVMESYNSIPEGFKGPIEGWLKGNPGYLMQMGGKEIKPGTINPKTKKPYTDKEIEMAKGSPIVQYEDTKKFILGNISRVLAGEKGVLTDKDIDRIEKAFPTKLDTPGTAASKMAQIKDFIRRRVENYKQTATQNIQNMHKQGATDEISQQEVDPEYQRYLDLVGEAQ